MAHIAIIPISSACRVFKNHEDTVTEVVGFQNGRWMVTGSHDTTLCLWDMKDGVVLKKMEGHGDWVCAVAVSGNGRFIASGDWDGGLIAWDGDTGESLTKVIKAHSFAIASLDFSPDSAVLATVSPDGKIKFWRTDTWQTHGNLINDVGEGIYRVRYSPSGKHLAIVTEQYIQIWNPSGLECIAKLTANCFSLAWTPDGTRLLSGGNDPDPKIREWDTSTWKQVGDDWCGHTTMIYALAVNSTGTLLASVSDDNSVRLWRISDQRTVAVFKHSERVLCVTFSVDGKYVLSGGSAKDITEWGVPDDVFLEDRPNAPSETLQMDVAEEPGTNDTSDHHWHYRILSINTILRKACVTSNLSTAQELLAQQIKLDRQNHNAYANRSFIFSRTCDWDDALHDALQSLSIQPSLPGYISKAIALCGKLEFSEATKAFDLAFMFTAQDLNTTRLILLVKAIAFFNANRQEGAMHRIKELANICPDADTVVCHVVEAYLHVQLGIKALNDARHDEAADHFTDAINSGVLSNEREIHSKYEVFVMLFGWDLASSWRTAHQNRCHAFLQAGRLVEAHQAYTSMIDVYDDATKASCLQWSISFKTARSVVYVANADAALAASEYDRAIEIYSAVIDLDAGTDTLFAKRCQAKLGKMLWEEALIDARKVTELNPRSYLGFHLKHAALHGMQQYDEAIEAFETMLLHLDDACDPDIQALRQQYMSPSEAQCAIQKVTDARMEHTPPRLINTSSGRLCDRQLQMNTPRTSAEYKELLSFTIKNANVGMQRIQEAVATFFSYVMLSHRWEEKEARLHEIDNKVIYELNPISSVVKLQSFCKIVRDAGHRWAWIDTCCIDQNNNVELQRSVNSMFAWYRHSTLTIIYLSDVPPSSRSGAMAESTWITRGWTVQEFLAPNIVLFYQNDWTLYLNDRSSNHKESAVIMRELEIATGINGQALTAFRPGMTDAREKLQWASMRVTTLPEDIAYSLFGLFSIHLPVIYGETKQNALGRLLQEIIAQSGDISCLDWVGRSSEFNSCLPASITSYASPSILPSLSEEETETSVSSLRDAGAAAAAVRLYATLDRLSVPRFAHRRLHLPCIAFTVTEVARRSTSQEQVSYLSYVVKANGLDDLLITTEDKLIPSSRRMPNRQKMLLVRPWTRDLLETYGVADFDDDSDAQSIMTDNLIWLPRSLSGDSDNLSAESGSDSQALRLLVRLGQPFKGLLLAQRGREFCRIAADHDITARIRDMVSAPNVMRVTTLEIL